MFQKEKTDWKGMKRNAQSSQSLTQITHSDTHKHAIDTALSSQTLIHTYTHTFQSHMHTSHPRVLEVMTPHPDNGMLLLVAGHASLPR